MKITKDEISQALARGYTHKSTESKVLDVDLIKAMAEEIMKVLNRTNQN